MTRPGVLYLSIATLTYGVLHVIDKAVLNQGIPAPSYTVCRVFIAFFILALFTLARPHPDWKLVIRNSNLRDLLIIGVLASGWGLLLQTFGLTFTSATNVSMLLGLVAPFTAFLPS